jgi:hypothetical protein
VTGSKVPGPTVRLVTKGGCGSLQVPELYSWTLH